MGIVFDDDFSGYSVGQPLPFGPWSGGGAIVGFGTKPDLTQSLRVDTAASFQNIVFKMTLYYSLLIDSGDFPGAMLNIYNTDPSLPFGPPLVSLALERDFSVTVTGFAGDFTDGSGNVSNSMIQNKQYLQPGVWHFLEVSIDFSAPTPHITSDVTVTIDNTAFCNGSQDSGLLPGSTFLGLRAVNIHQFIAANFARIFVDNVTLYNDVGQPLPHPATPPAPLIRATQYAADWLKQPDNGHIRATQFATEWLKQPNNGHIRATQMVLEVIASSGNGGVLPEYIKRRLASN